MIPPDENEERALRHVTAVTDGEPHPLEFEGRWVGAGCHTRRRKEAGIASSLVPRANSSCEHENGRTTQ